MPNQKLGMLMPNRPNMVPTLSVAESGLAPANTPRGSAIKMAMMIANVASSSVAGSRDAIRSVTGWAKRKDRPRLPCAAFAMKYTYWTRNGLSRPQRAFASATSASVASSGRSSEAGSPGARCSSP
jgi:hypothetical protein